MAGNGDSEILTIAGWIFGGFLVCFLGYQVAALIVLAIPWILGIGAIILALTIIGCLIKKIYKSISTKKEEQGNRQREDWQEEDKAAIKMLDEESVKEAQMRRYKRCYKHIHAFIQDNKLLDSFLVIDSNIWMSTEYTVFFQILEQQVAAQQKQIILYGPQFDEICNIKTKTEFGEAKNALARTAIDRIEKLNAKKLLRVEPITLDAKPGAYADPLIIKLLAKAAKDNKATCLVSDDKELRVRTREYLRNSTQAEQHIVVGLGQIREACQTLITVTPEDITEIAQ